MVADAVGHKVTVESVTKDLMVVQDVARRLKTLKSLMKICIFNGYL